MLRHYPFLFGMRLSKLRRKVISKALGKPDVGFFGPDLLQVMKAFRTDQLDLENLWHDARMEEVLVYLRGSQRLQVPPEFQQFLPKTVLVPSNI